MAWQLVSKAMPVVRGTLDSNGIIMEDIFGWAYRRALLVLGMAAIVAALAGLGWPDLRIDTRVDATLPDAGPGRDDASTVRFLFGNLEKAVVDLSARDGALTEERLKALKRLRGRLLEIEGVKGVESVLDIQVWRRDEGNRAELEPLFAEAKDSGPTEEWLEQASTQAAAVPRLLAPDGTRMSLYVSVDHSLRAEARRELAREVREAALAISPAFDDVGWRGDVFVEEVAAEQIALDQVWILGLAALSVGILATFFTGAPWMGLATIVVGAFATILLGGLMSILGLAINPLTQMLPALLLVLFAPVDARLMWAWRQGVGDGADGLASIRETGRALGLMVWLSALILALCLGAFMGASIPMLREFGIVGAMAVALRLLLTVLVLPALLRFDVSARARRAQPASAQTDSKWSGADPASVQADAPDLRLGARWGRWIGGAPLSRMKAIYGTVGIVAALLVYPALQTPFETDPAAWSPVGEDRAVALRGPAQLSLLLRGDEGFYHSIEGVRELYEIGEAIRRRDEVFAVASFADYVVPPRLEDQDGAQEGDGASVAVEDVIPDSVKMLQRIQAAAAAEDDRLREMINDSGSRARIIVLANSSDAEQIQSLAGALDRLAEEIIPRAFSDLIAGSFVLEQDGQSALRATHLLVMGAVGFTLFVVVSVIFVSLRMGLTVVLLDAVPLVVLYAVLGLTGTPLDLGLVLLPVLALGLSVDSTLYLMVRFRRNLWETRDETRALERTMAAEFVSIVGTVLGVAVGFAALASSSFAPLQSLGLWGAMLVGLVPLVDLTLTPLLLARTPLITLADMFHLRLRDQLLEQADLLQGFTRLQAKKVLLACHTRRLEAGAVLIKEGEFGEVMYVLTSGCCQVLLGEGEDAREIERVYAGDSVGEVALTAKVKRTANVVVLEPTEVLVIDWNTLERFRRFAPGLASRLFLNICRMMGRRFAGQLGRERQAGSRAPFPPS